MNTNNEQNISRHWSGFRWVWWLIALLLAFLLLLMWAMGYGPNGKSCQIPEKVRTVEKLIVAPDTVAPLITLNDNPVVKLFTGETYQDAGAKAIDGIDGDLAVTTTGLVDTQAPGEYEITYSVTDAAGNSATEVRKVIVVAKDTEAPEITLVKDEVVYVKTGDLYVDEGAVATDIPDGELRVITEGMVDTSKAGEYVVTYSATDKAGNKTSKSRKVIVTDPDSESPVITLNGESVIQLLIGEDYIEKGAKAIDNVDGELKVIDVTGEVNASKAGEYLITYRVKDDAGNVTELVRKVIVSAPDKAAPKVTLNGSETLNLKVGETYEEDGATAVDVVDGDVKVVVEGSVDTTKVGQATINYTAKDSAGNSATVTRTVIVTAADAEAPEIVLNSASSIRLTVGDSYSEAGATATDKEDGSVAVDVSGKVDSNTAGNYVVTYTAIDKAGNKATETRKVEVVEAEVEAKPAPSPAEEKPVPTSATTELTTSKAKVYFEYDKANNPRDNDGSFAQLLSYMKANDKATATIYGFHDPSGDRNYNRGLASRRAETVSLVMMAAGIQSTRLKIKNPVETTGTGEPSEARRVEIDIK